ncbi:hypothetical protein KKF91_03495 [Myxococcota bacterium]|nr:hypothetical protein [Myxococcota bacterium]MBU1429606.1 hypothetical protein [Myxococcota bacterium]MBU1897412.1 hypothetical protein [Myxococcota bacterium]
MRTRLGIMSLLALLALSGLSTAIAGKKKPTRAQPAAKAANKATAPRLAAFLGEIEWGASHEAVFGWLDKKLEAKYDALAEDVSDAIEIDRLIKAKRAESKALRETYVRFDGQRSGYEASIIAKDFVQNGGESMLRVDTPEAQNFYFFKHDRLWKVVVSYHSRVAQKITFAQLVTQLKAKHGQAKMKHEDKVAIWTDAETQLSAEDRTEFYSAYVMKYVEKVEGVALDEARAETTAAGGGEEVDSLMAGIMGGADEAVDTDVVDRLTGQRHHIEVDAPEQAPLERDHATAEEAQAPSKKTKKPNKAKKPKKPKKRTPAEPLDPPPPGADEHGIVY